MEKTKHTPGPWRIQGIEDGYALISSQPNIGPRTWDKFASVVVQMEFDPEQTPVGKANARLIVSAPCLLKELKAAHRIISNALNLMTLEQKAEWGRLNERDGVDGEGVTRAHERDAVLTKATEAP